MAATIENLAKRITPESGEDQPAFAIRFHTVARRALPDTQQRQTAMMQAWAGAGDELAQQAAVDFPSDKYERREGVCEFKEHVAHNADGSKSHYSRDELAAMVRNMNRRVADTGNYGGLIDGHTSDDPSAPQPDVLGYRGPYYLGQIGRQEPRWAIFSVEHHKRECIPRLASKTQRSAEVWRSPRIEDRILDPVAALGAETPRLDLGMVRYQRTGTVKIDGQQIERYAAACMPGAASVAVPTDKYAEPEGADMALSPEDAQAIAGKCAEIIMDTPEWQFVQSQMGAGDGAADDTAEEVVDDAGSDSEPVEDAPAAEPTDDSLEAVDEAPAEASPEPQSASQSESDEYAEPEVPDAPAPVPAAETEPEAEDSNVPDRVAELEAEVAALKAQLQGNSAEKYRRESLQSMRDRGFQIDVEDQLEIVGEMTGDQFEKYAKGLERSVARVPLADSPDMHDPPTETPKPRATTGSEPEMERYSRAAVKHVTSERAAGRHVEFADALELAQSGQI